MFINNFLVLLVFIYSFKRRSKASTSGVAQTLIAQNTLSDGGMEEEDDARVKIVDSFWNGFSLKLCINGEEEKNLYRLLYHVPRGARQLHTHSFSFIMHKSLVLFSIHKCCLALFKHTWVRNLFFFYFLGLLFWRRKRKKLYMSHIPRHGLKF